MAKQTVFSYKIQVDGQEVEQSINSLNGFQERLVDLKQKLASTPLNAPQFRELEKEIKRTEGAFESAKNKNKGFVDQLAGLPGIFGQVGQSIQGAGQFFGNFNMLLKASPIGLLATIVASLIQKFSQMEGVLDPLTKITSIFSGVMGKLANVILPPISAILEGIAVGAEKVANFFGELIGGSEGTGDALSYVADTYDQLEDSQAAYELSQKNSNRALQEAREIAADSTKPIEDRIQALKDAEKLEREIAKQGRERALAKARAQAIEIATELGYSKDKIEKLKQANAQEIKNFADSVTELKKLNREKLNTLYGGLGDIQEIQAQESKIGTKTQKQINALYDERAAQDKAANQEAAARAKERRQVQKENIDAEIKLLLTFREDNIQKDAVYYQKIEQQLRDYYKKKNALEDADKKLTKTQLENRRREQEDAIKKGLQGLIDANDKQKKLNEDLKKSEEDIAKAKKGITTDQLVLLQQQQTELDINYQKEKERLENDLKIKKQIYGEDSEQYKLAQIAKNNAEANYLNKTNENNQKTEDLVKARNERLKNLDLLLEQERVDGLKDGLEKQLATINDGERKKIDAYKKTLDELVKNGDITLQQAAEKLANYTTLVTTKTREATKAAIGDDFLKNILQGVDTAISGTSATFFGVYDKINEAKDLLDKGLKAGTVSLEQYQKGIADLNQKLISQNQKLAGALNAVAQGAMTAAQGFGEETAAGKILIKVSQAAALANTALALSEAIAGLGKDLKKGFPTNIVAVASTLALIGTAFGQAKALFKKQVSETQSEEPRKLAGGGLVSGSGTSTSDSIPARLSNGESVINARSTAMFTPLLSAINQAGGGKPFAFGGVVSPQEVVAQQQSASLIQALSQSQGQPIKTYVVAQDMTSMQMFDRAQKSRSTL